MSGTSALADAVGDHYACGTRLVSEAFANMELPDRGLISAALDKVIAGANSDVFSFPRGEELSALWHQRQLQAYLVDLVATAAPPQDGRHLRATRQMSEISRVLGVESYFDAYCWSRGIDSEAVVKLSHQFLESTAAWYWASFKEQFGASTQVVSRGALSQILFRAVTDTQNQYTIGRIVSDLRSIVRDLELEQSIEIHLGSPTQLTTNIDRVKTGGADVYVASADGLEAYRGAFHALGHAIYSADRMTHLTDNIGVNISGTEVAAFQAQHLALDEVNEEFSATIRFIHLFQGRLYAVRTLSDFVMLKPRRSPSDEGHVDLARAHLGIDSLSYWPVQGKLVDVDFVIAFRKFYGLDEMRPEWASLRSGIGRLQNRDVASSTGILASL